MQTTDPPDAAQGATASDERAVFDWGRALRASSNLRLLAKSVGWELADRARVVDPALAEAMGLPSWTVGRLAAWPTVTQMRAALGYDTGSDVDDGEELRAHGRRSGDKQVRRALIELKDDGRLIKIMRRERRLPTVYILTTPKAGDRTHGSGRDGGDRAHGSGRGEGGDRTISTPATGHTGPVVDRTHGSGKNNAQLLAQQRPAARARDVSPKTRTASELAALHEEHPRLDQLRERAGIRSDRSWLPLARRAAATGNLDAIADRFEAEEPKTTPARWLSSLVSWAEAGTLKPLRAANPHLQAREEDWPPDDEEADRAFEEQLAQRRRLAQRRTR